MHNIHLNKIVILLFIAIAKLETNLQSNIDHFLNLVCHLFLVCVKNTKFTTENFSDDEDATLSEDDDDAWEDLESESSAEAREKIIRGYQLDVYNI